MIANLKTSVTGTQQRLVNIGSHISLANLTRIKANANIFGRVNSYFDSEGNKYSQSQIDFRIKRAGLEILDLQFLEHGYNFCEC